MAKFNAYDSVTATILDLMSTHGSNWIKPWGVNGGGLQVSAETGKAYTGINQLLLMSSQYADNRWGTYKAWKRMGAQVNKGEKGTQIIFFKPLSITDRDTGEEKNIPMARVYTVFNASQVEGVAPLEKPQDGTGERIKAVEAFVSATGADIRHGHSGAFYKPTADWVGMPNLESFLDTDASTATENYYSTLLHELSHWTGHRSRLDRKLDQSRFGDSAYAFEELVAELGAAFACAALGITNEPRPDHAQYLASWVRVLKKDNKAIVKAAKLAQQAFEYIEGLATEGEKAATA